MVHFVGAGCGAEDLITVRGLRLVEKADLIIYAGSLVNEKILKNAKSDCKICNSAYMTLEEVIEEMSIAEENGKDTVRLHTGDPSIYGAIREQMDALRRKNIEFDICPGVSSFLGAASSLRAEYTLPNVSQSLIITRMEGKTKVPPKESIESFAAHNATMIIFLSASMTKELREKLIAGGYKKDTPAAIVYKATWEDEKIIRCIIDNLDVEAEKNGIRNFALIVVGEFLGNEYELSKLYDKNFTTAFRQGDN